MPWNYTLGAAAWRVTRVDGCNLAIGLGCPCWRGYCLFDLEADPAERNDVSERLPHVVKRMLKRLTEASAGGTQGAHLCHAAAEAAKRGLADVLARRRAYLPYVNESSATVWHDDRAARSCYNPCPLRVIEPKPAAHGRAFEAGIPAWCASLDGATPAK